MGDGPPYWGRRDLLTHENQPSLAGGPNRRRSAERSRGVPAPKWALEPCHRVYLPNYLPNAPVGRADARSGCASTPSRLGTWVRHETWGRGARGHGHSYLQIIAGSTVDWQCAKCAMCTARAQSAHMRAVTRLDVAADAGWTATEQPSSHAQNLFNNH